MAKKGSAPKAPDPQETSAAQTSTNIGSAIANNIMGMTSQYSPTGSLEYNQTGTQNWTDPFTGKSYAIPTYESVTRLNPTAQKTFDYNQMAEQNLARTAQDQSAFLGNYLKGALSPNGLPARGQLSSTGDISDIRTRAERALIKRIAPAYLQEREQLETDLVNRGVGIGSEAYQDAKFVQNQKENDARMAAVLAGGQEAANTLNMDLARAGYKDSQRGQALNEMFAFRNQPINEIISLLSGSQVQMPNFAGYQSARIPTTDVSGNIWNAYNADLANWQNQQAQSQNLWGNLIGAGGKIAGGFI